MKIYYSDYNNTSGTTGTSLTDYGNASFNTILSNSNNYSAVTSYTVGQTVIDQGVVWRCILNSTGIAPPTLPTLSNTYWEYIGSQGNFTWIAYGDSTDNGVTITNISTTAAGTRQWIGIAYNKSNTNETTVQSDYTWSKITGISPVTISTNKPSVSIPTDSDGLNQSYTTSTDTRLSVLEGNSVLTYDAVGTSSGTWKVTSVNSTATLSAVIITGTAGQFSCSAAPVTLAVGTPIVISGTFGGTGSITGYTNPKTYYIIATNGSTTFTLSATNGGVAITTTAGTPTGLTYSITGIAAGSASIGGGGTYATYSAVSAMVADTAFIEYTVQGTTASGATFSGVKLTQTFSKVRGAIVDITPPAVPTGLSSGTVTSALITTPSGDIQVKLTASWTANTETDFSYYIVAIQEGSGTFIEYNTTSTSFEWYVKPNTSYTVKVKAADKSDNRSAFCTVVTVTSVKKTVAPSAPTALTTVATFKNIFLSWTNSADVDLKFVEVWRNTTNNSGTATKIATVNATYNTPGAFSDSSGISNGTLYYYWLKSVDSSGNISGFSTLNTTTLSTVIVTGTAGQFSCTSTTLILGQVVIISGTFGGTGSITGYTNPTTYVISATNGSTTFTLVKTDGTALTTTAGTPTGLTYTKHDAAAVPAAVGAADIIAGSITADRIRSGELTADLIAVPAAGNYLNPSIQVGVTTGVTIGNPISIIENSSTATTISPGKILISGATTLANWRNGTDSTKIEGGSIYANTISANSIALGSRGLTFTGIVFTASSTTNITWTSGTVSYTDDAGLLQSVNIAAQGTAVTRTATNTVYLYWVKGATTISNTTALGTATGTDRILIATWVASSTSVNANYGRTIIDGSSIVTNSITANQIATNSITADRIDSRSLSIKDAAGTVIFAAGTPLTSTYIASVDAGTITAGSISTDRINLDGITLSKDITTGKLRISALGVDTAYIANNAVTNIQSAYTSSSISCPDNTETSVQTQAITSTGLPILLIASVMPQTLTANAAYVQVRVYRGTTLIWTGTTYVSSNGAFGPIITTQIVDTPTAGTYTYKIALYVTPVSGATTSQAINRCLTLTEIKK